MSVAPLQAKEIATFAAICHKLDLLPYEKLLPLGELISAGNCAAWAATYSDRIEPIEPDDFERELLDTLADEQKQIKQHFGPLAYNMIANNGQAFSEVFGAPIEQDSDILTAIRELEEKASDWQAGKQKELEHQEQNAQAFNEVGQLETLTADEIKTRCKAAGKERVIYAQFKVDQSCGYTDYHGGRTTRTVVIGFGKGKRENFKQLRKAAGEFPATGHLGPGKGDWRLWINQQDPNEHNHAPSTRVHEQFATEQEAQAWIDKAIADQTSDGLSAESHGYSITDRGIENRENYSMGGGNYLGHDRYSGWQVSSHPLEWFNGDHEFYQPTEPSAIQKHHHTKRKFDFWLIKPPQRVDRETFETHRTKCQSLDGWYSRKWSTTPGGFAFKNEEVAQQFHSWLKGNS